MKRKVFALMAMTVLGLASAAVASNPNSNTSVQPNGRAVIWSG